MAVTQVEPFYATLADRLRRDIHAGVYPAGEKLPTEAALVEMSGLARGTVRQAIEALVGEGLVVSRSGRGHYVRHSTRLVWRASDPERNTNTDIGTGPNDAWSRSVRAQGRMPSEDIRTEILYANEKVAQWLHLPTGEPVSARRRVRYVDGEPHSTADSYYPRSIVAGTEVELPGDVLPGIYSVFERLGRPWTRTVDRVIPRQATREEARVLGVARGVAVSEIVRRSFDRDDVPVRLTLIVLPGDRHEIEYNIEEKL